MSNIDLSPEAIASLKALAQKATPGPWAVKKFNGGPYPGPFQIWRQAPPGEALVSISVEGRPNADYIAAAHPGVILAMCEEIERLRAEVARLEKESDYLARRLSIMADRLIALVPAGSGKDDAPRKAVEES